MSNRYLRYPLDRVSSEAQAATRNSRTACYRFFLPVLFCLASAALIGCASKAPASMQVSRQTFGQTADEKEVYLFTLRNPKGAEARISNYGGLVTSLKVPDRDGKMGDVVLGFDNVADYIKDSPYFGALIGRYGNRIARGKFTLDGKQYTLATNNYPNALHGGTKGFDKVVWEPTILTGPEGASLKLTYLSKDMEEGYPGNLSVTVIYTLTDDNALKVEYAATTDQDTVVNLTQHSYFNLACKDSILNHVVMIPADKFTPVDSTLIPTGDLRSVEGTPFDFRNPTAIGARINQDDEQLKFGKGYDHNWIINKPMGQYGLMARVTEPTTGRVLEVFSTEPSLQFYTGNFLDGTLKGKGGRVYEFRSGFCMESQHYPDSPNQPKFPSVVLKPGQTYHNIIVFKFSTGS
jgi:aldose 1-epimerase